MRKIRDEYIPKDSEISKRMKLICHDAREWETIEIATYDKVRLFPYDFHKHPPSLCF